MIPNISSPQSEAFLDAEAGFEYFASLAHYQSIAGRILAALAGGGRFVLLTGNPPANGRLLSNALSKAAGGTHTVIGVPCGQNLTRDDWRRLVPGPSGDSEIHEFSAAALLVALGTPLPLYVLEDADQLSDEQLQEFFATWLFGEPTIGTAVLAVTRAFLTRLERPALSFLIEGLAARLQFQHLGPDEIGTFVRQQLPSDDAERAFSADTIAAITAASGGDPILVNRLASRALDSHRGNTIARPTPATRATVSPAVVPPAPQSAETPKAPLPESDLSALAAPALVAPLDEPPAAAPPATRRRGVARRLAIGSVFALAYFGILLLVGSYIPKYFRPASDEPVAGAPQPTDVPPTPPAAGAASSNAEAPALEALPPAPSENQADGAIVAPPAPDATAGAAPEPIPPMPQGQPATVSGDQAQGAGQTVQARDTTDATLREPTISITETPPAAVKPASGPTADLSATISVAPSAPLEPPALPVPPAKPAGLPTDIAALVARGDALLNSGDIVSARLYYERAANAGDSRAAMLMGETYDPDFLARAGVRGVRGDAAIADSWYRRARELSDRDAARGSEIPKTQ